MLFLLLGLFRRFECDHNRVQDMYLRSSAPETLLSDDTPTVMGEKGTIRIVFDTLSISDGTKDTQQCKTVSTSCEKEDILDDKKRASIIGTIQAIQHYLDDLILVNRLVEPIDMSDSWSSFGGLDFSASVPNCDLYIPVVARKLVSTTLATAMTVKRNTGDSRPIAGLITINPRTVPDAPQNETSGDRSFFTTILHELNHVLAFSDSNFGFWRDPATSAPYSKVSETEENEDGIVFKRLITPNLKKFVNERFNVITPSIMDKGLELEDGGGSGTALSHPSSRLFFTDLMQGKTYGPAYVSPIFFESLTDSGWYEVNQTRRAELEEVMNWLGESTVTEAVITDTPWTSFPPEYKCDTQQQMDCFGDYSFKGICSMSTPHAYIRDNKWYNPYNMTHIGTEELVDYFPVLLPTMYNCRDTNTPDIIRAYSKESSSYSPDKYAETYGPSSMCARSTVYRDYMLGYIPTFTASCFSGWCGTDYRPRFQIKGKNIFCREPGLKFSVPGYWGLMECPPTPDVCMNRPLVPVLNMISVVPDRGPSEGKNYISIKGFGFDKYDTQKLTLSIGSVNLTIVSKTDKEILCLIGEIPESQRNTLVNKPQTLKGYVEGMPELNTELEGMYIFTDRKYNSGVHRSSPALFLLACVAVVATIL